MRARWDATSCEPQLPLDRCERCCIGEAGRVQAVLTLELRHRRHRVAPGDSVLFKRGVGAELVERLLHPQRSVRRLLVSLEWDGRHAAHCPLYLLEHVVGLPLQFGLVATDRSPVALLATLLTQPDRRCLYREAGHLLAHLLETEPVAAADILQVLGRTVHSFGEDRLIAAAVPLVFVE